MKKEYRCLLENRQVTEAMLMSCLVTCENIIRANAYLEKQWKDYSDFSNYTEERLMWSDYRAKIRKALQRKYEMKKIISMTKTYKEIATMALVKAIVELIDTGDYTLV